MPDEMTVDEWRRTFGRGAKPQPVGRPALKVPAAPRAPADAGETTRQRYCDRGWLFVQLDRDLLRYAYHRHTGARIGPAVQLAALLAMIDEHEAGAP